MAKAKRSRITTSQSSIASDVRVLEQQKDSRAVVKVAAYCRVSTDMEIQKQSLETQMAAYNKIIEEHPGWVLAGIYADRGISGTTVRHREEFKRMIEDARQGKIQYILAKSISRFSRNTVDALAYVRELKSYGVSVYFEKEKLDTGSAVSEFLLSIFAAAAQEEIISLSNNMKVGRRMRYAAGIPQWAHIYGYYLGDNGEWLIQEEEAAVVRRIFDEYTSGKSLPEICRGLEADGISSSGGKSQWMPKSTADILHNEKYIGDVRMQKTFVSDPIQHTKVENREAKLKQYYKENHHQAIVDRSIFQMAQDIAAMKDLHRGTTQYPYYGFLKCPICGENMIRCKLPRNNHTFGWTCGGKATSKGTLRKKRTSCPPYYIVESYIDSAFNDAMKSANSSQLRGIGSGYGEEAKQAQTILALQIRAASEKVEYRTLCELIKQITFPRWTMMRVEWLCGIVSEAELVYKKISDMPWPTISRETIERDTSKGKVVAPTYIVNGEIVVKGCPDRQIEGIERARDYIQHLTILEPKVYEPNIPRVYGGYTKSENEEVEASTRKVVQQNKYLDPRTEKRMQYRRENCQNNQEEAVK